MVISDDPLRQALTTLTRTRTVVTDLLARLDTAVQSRLGSVAAGSGPPASAVSLQDHVATHLAAMGRSVTTCRDQVVAVLDDEITRVADSLPGDGPDRRTGDPGSPTRADADETDEPTTSAERIAAAVGPELAALHPGYVCMVAFGTPGGHDLDLRVFFESLDDVDQDAVRALITERLRDSVADVELWFHERRDLDEGLADERTFGPVETLLREGFDPQRIHAAVGDTSLITTYVFATMRLLHRNPSAPDVQSPGAAVDRLVLTHDGAVAWTHWFTGTFLHEYVQYRQGERTPEEYRERLAKFLCRTSVGSTLAQLRPWQLQVVKRDLVAAIQRADGSHSTDELMCAALTRHPVTAPLIDSATRGLLEVAGQIRSGRTSAVPDDFVDEAEAALFYTASRQGWERRQPPGGRIDPLTSYALGGLSRAYGTRRLIRRGEPLVVQGAVGSELIHIPLTSSSGAPNADVSITIRDMRGGLVAHHHRSAGGVIGHYALLGTPRSATVIAEGDIEAYVLPADVVGAMLTDPDIQAELRTPVLVSPEARSIDVLLRYLSREVGIFLRQSTAYTFLASHQLSQSHVEPNPLQGFDLGHRFYDVLRAAAVPWQPGEPARPPVALERVGPRHDRMIFDVNDRTDRFYVVSDRSVRIAMRNGAGFVVRKPGDFFGESSMLKQGASGRAVAEADSAVLSIDPAWFERFTQSRQPIRGVLPVELLYHVAAQHYERARMHLAGLLHV